ncbi:MAG: tagaturonate epimerase family protein, partial [Planctomycetes bacterium]|nr:tagaturonate epimerase family protein [Planctomycetota bacterium]
MKFGNLEIDPAVNPAVLDTATWDPERAWQIVRSVEPQYWHAVLQALAGAESLPADERCMVYRGSWAQRGASTYFLAGLSDGQYVFVEVGVVDRRLIAPLYVIPLGGGIHLAMYAADAAAVRSYVQKMRPDKGPRAMGAVPRLGIGTRMSTSVWPGIWRAMDERKFAANAIQNSVRELNLLEDVLAGRPARTNYLYGFGTLPEGHTGSTFEGLWVAGVIEALKSETQPTYGADADHITIRRESKGLERAKRVIDAARDYTFFTLDVSDIVDYAAAAAAANKYRTARAVVAEP